MKMRRCWRKVIRTVCGLGLVWTVGLRAAGEAPAPETGASSSFRVVMRVDTARVGPTLKPVWRFFGADEPNYATRRNGRRLIAELGELRRGEVYFRAHNLLTSGDGTPALKWGSTGAYREDEAGRPVYDWTILDRIFGTYIDNGVRPYVEIGFMPRDLSVRPEPYQHAWTPTARYEEIYTGWAWPPKDYAKWEALVGAWARHCVDYFGKSEVERWYWQVWNEANIGYWRGTREEFLRLHDHAIAAVRRALPTARVGGPDVAGHGGDFTRAFIEHCLRGTNHATGRIGTPLDFVSFHAKGRPEFVGGHVRMGLAEQLRTVDQGFALVASYPELRRTPIVIGECDPDGCAACQGPQLGYRNTPLYASFTAGSFARIQELAARREVVLDGILTWAFTFEDQPLFAGFRQLASGGIDLPVMNVFRMFSRMSGRQLAVASDGALEVGKIQSDGVRDRPDVAAVACLDGSRVAVLLWHYHDDDLPGPEAEVALRITPASFAGRRATVRHFRIDGEHGNAYAAWVGMGSPAKPTPWQEYRLQRAGRLQVGPPVETRRSADGLELRLRLPRHAVSLLEVE